MIKFFKYYCNKIFQAHNYATCVLLTCLILLFHYPSCAQEFSEHFFVIEKFFDFTKTTKNGKCTGQLPYPLLSNADETLISEINTEIFDFVESYAICNKNDHSNFSVTCDLPDPDSDNYFSVKWITKKNGEIYRIDSLSFDINNADLVAIDDIFNPLATTMLSELVELSDGYLQSDITWETFLDKIGRREIQYYIKNGEWYIVFNSTNKLHKVIDTKIPKYFLRGDDVTGTR